MVFGEIDKGDSDSEGRDNEEFSDEVVGVFGSGCLLC